MQMVFKQWVLGKYVFSMAELLCVCLCVCKIGTRIVSFDLIFFTLHVITVDIIFFIGGMNSRNSFQSCRTMRWFSTVVKAPEVCGSGEIELDVELVITT